MEHPPASGADLAARVMAVASDAFISIDRDSVIRDWNPAAAALFGWSIEEAIGRPLAETLIPAGLRDAHHAGLARFLATGEPRVMGQRLELSAVHRNGRELPVELTIWPAEVGGEFRFRAFIHDISAAHRQARYIEAHHGVAQALATATTLPEGIQAAMRAIARSFGWTWATFWRADGNALRAEVIWRAEGARGEDLARVVRARDELPTTALRAGSTVFSDDLPDPPTAGLRTAVALPVRDATGLTGVLEFFGTEAVASDPGLADALETVGTVVGQFVRRCRQTEELSLAHTAALEASRMKSEFLANTSHEIRTPLNGVIGMTDLLRRTSLTPIQREYAETVTASAQSLLAVINDILDFSKIEAGKLELDEADFTLRDVIEDAVAAFGQPAWDKGVELVTWIDPAAPAVVRGDAGRVRQVLVNLVSNAVKFTPAGEIVVSLESAVGTGDGVTLQFSVRDTGIGLEPAQAERLFESFAQADASTTRRFGGTGLGLAICRQLVTLMGGAIAVSSRPGAGTTFRFDVRLGMGSGPVAGGDTDLEGLSALVVDDNATNRTILEAQLAGWGMRCDVAQDAVRALELLEAAAAHGAPYDVALVDFHMPGTDGLTLCRRVADRPHLRTTRLVMLTSGLTDAELASAAGLSAYLTKPVRQARLRDAVAGVIVAPPPAAPAPAATSSGRVLVAEDHPVNQLVVRKLLEQEGFAVDLASDGAEAIRRVAETNYDLVFMDCQMPALDGYQATATIRATTRGADVPIVALTAHAMAGDRERCLAAGMDDYLAKPIVPAELARVLAAFGGRGDGVLDRATVVRLQNEFDAATRRQLVDLFLVHAPESLAALRAGAADPEIVRAEAHRLKGTCLNLGAHTMRRLCAELETASPEDVPASLEALEAAFTRTREALEAQLVD